jgi:hypothetical protein
VRTLVAGWFSFDEGHATAGDLMAREVACDWIAAAGCPYEVAATPALGGGVDWRTVDPARYEQVVFVCGPFDPGRLEQEFVERFRHARLVGLNLSMPTPLQTWNPFQLLFARNSSAEAWPDLAFLSGQRLPPVIGVCRVEEYDGAQVAEADRAIERVLAGREGARVDIDTRLDRNAGGLRNAAEVEAVVARVDLVVTTRLHGMVLALRNGVPAVAIDPEPAAAKLRRQAERLGWPLILDTATLTDGALREAVERGLTAESRAEARRCRDRARADLSELRKTFLASMAAGTRLT